MIPFLFLTLLALLALGKQQLALLAGLVLFLVIAYRYLLPQAWRVPALVLLAIGVVFGILPAWSLNW